MLSLVAELPEVVNGIQFALQNNVNLGYVDIPNLFFFFFFGLIFPKHAAQTCKLL